MHTTSRRVRAWAQRSFASFAARGWQLSCRSRRECGGKKSHLYYQHRVIIPAQFPCKLHRYPALFFRFIACLLRGMKGSSRRNEPVCVPCASFRACTYLITINGKKWSRERERRRASRSSAESVVKFVKLMPPRSWYRSAHRRGRESPIIGEIAPLIVPPVIWVNEVDKHTRRKIEKLKVPNTCRC